MISGDPPMKALTMTIAMHTDEELPLEKHRSPSLENVVVPTIEKPRERKKKGKELLFSTP